MRPLFLFNSTLVCDVGVHVADMRLLHDISLSFAILGGKRFDNPHHYFWSKNVNAVAHVRKMHVTCQYT